MNSAEFFSARSSRAAGGWLILCAAFVAAAWAGIQSDQLFLTTLGLIFGFVLAQGVIPALILILELQGDAKKCRREESVFRTITLEELRNLPRRSRRRTGSLYALIYAVCFHASRITKSQAVESFLKVVAETYRARLERIQLSSEQAPLLGLAASMVGILLTLLHLGTAMQSQDQEVIRASFADAFSAFSVMVATTLAGCAGSFVVMGLASIADTAANRHLAELRLLGDLLITTDDDLPDSQTREHRDEESDDMHFPDDPSGPSSP